MKDFKKDAKDFFKKIVVSVIEWEAKKVLKKYKPMIIAVTGSVGKTSTKDAIYAVLSKSFYVRKSEKSFNSEVGIPLTILGCDNAWSNPFLWFQNIVEGLLLILFKNHYPKMLVLEVGADRPGDIEKASAWLSPDVVVVTQFANVPAHIEYFKSPEKVIEEKSYLVKALKPGGLLVLNHDDERVLATKNLTKAHVFTYGTKADASLVASHYSFTYASHGGRQFPTGVTFKVTHGGTCLSVNISGTLGRHHMYPALSAISVGLSFGLNLVEMAQVFSDYTAPNGRMKLISGIKNSLIIDDTYNSSPIAVHEALETLKEIKTQGRKIAVLGDMLELGKYSVDEHKNVGREVSRVANTLIIVGLLAKKIAEGANEADMDRDSIFEFENSRDAGVFLSQEIMEGDIILIKGSQGMRMEHTVLSIMSDLSQKEKLLVRQDKEWAGR